MSAIALPKTAAAFSAAVNRLSLNWHFLVDEYETWLAACKTIYLTVMPDSRTGKDASRVYLPYYGGDANPFEYTPENMMCHF